MNHYPRIGSCSKIPVRIVGRRVRVMDGPRTGESGLIDGVSGPFALPHDGLGECECVHIAEDSAFCVLFFDGETCSGYRVFDLAFVDPNDEPVHLAVRHPETRMFSSPDSYNGTACRALWGYAPRRTLLPSLVTCERCKAVVITNDLVDGWGHTPKSYTIRSGGDE